MIYRACWQIASRRALDAALGHACDAAEVDRELAGLVVAGLLAAENGSYLALALRQPGYRRAPSWPEIRSGDMVPYMLCSADG